MPQKDSADFYRNTWQQFMDLYVQPEITRRQEAGEAPTPLTLSRAQIVFSLDGSPPKVRLNDEVRCVGSAKIKPGVSKEPGDPIYAHELDGFESLDLIEDERDCGHATFILIGDAWVLSFNFVYNRATSARHIEMAREFCDAARSSLEGGRRRSFLDALFSAAELAAKARLLGWFPDPRFKKKSSHRAIITRFHRYAYVGNAPQSHLKTLSRLQDLRRRARYSAEKLRLSDREARDLLSVVEDMIAKS